jgi:hypothetical protein
MKGNIPKAVQAGGDSGAKSPPGCADIRSLNLPKNILNFDFHRFFSG